MTTIIIPTKDRPQMLIDILQSLARQSLLPSEVVVVDQTANAMSFSNIKLPYELKYLHRADVKGLVEAKSVGVKCSKGDYICFLDDDSRPHSDFLKELVSGMKETGSAGMCGYVTNYEHTGKVLRILYPIFHRGYFRGNRMGVFGLQTSSSLNNYIGTHQVTGGCSIWQKDVFDFVSLDLDNRFHFFEDIDFSFQVNLVFEGRLYINTRAKIEDLYRSAGTRDYSDIIEARMREFRKIFEKYKGTGHIALIDYVLYVTGRALEATVVSVKEKSSSPIKGFLSGLFN